MSYGKPLLGEIFQEQFGLTAGQLQIALDRQKTKGGLFGESLVALGYDPEEKVQEALSIQLDLPWWPSIDPALVDEALLAKVPISFAKRFRLLPIMVQQGTLLVAVVDPLDITPLHDLELLLGLPISPVVTSLTALMTSLNQAYDRLVSITAEQVMEDLSTGTQLDKVVADITALEEPTDLLDSTDEAPIIRLVNSILYQAGQQRASDIHFEPFERVLLVRYRIDGLLHQVLSIPQSLQASVITRIKILASLDIAEKRKPQDGRFGIRIAGREVDIRVSVLPTAFGERVVLRLLSKSTRLLTLQELGLPPDLLPVVDQLIARPHGLLLVTGPTGSGKTTTLYTALSKINAPDKNILTIEDPIEYQLQGVGQMQVNPKIKLTFATGLRSILRQDPDVIMIGEIRDQETADIAIHAALTGHLVFSTLHTNDAPSAVTRLVDIGIEPFLVSSSVIGILAQRLVRVLCTDCREPFEPSPEELAALGLEAEKAPVLYQPVGCARCSQTGYRGRTGIYELFLPDDDLRRLMLTTMDATSLAQEALHKGMRTLQVDGARKVQEGITTTLEVLRISHQEGSV